ncbi:extracellular solute-binding protein [Patescibacteria group bacterium]|nr:extracellular solute-binding protein [Patescibacteria group bacterium]
MSKKHKKARSLLISVLMLGMLLTAVSACQAAKRVNLLIWSGYPEMAPFYEKVAKDYENLHPGVKIDVAAFGLRDFERKLSMAIPSGTESDIMQVSTYAIRKFVEAEYIPKNPPQINTFLKSGAFCTYIVQGNIYKEDFYGLPIYQGMKVMYWNKTMFAETGLTHSPQTWEELINYPQKLAKYDDRGGLVRSGISLRLSGGGSGVAEKWWCFLISAGGTIVKESPNGKYHNGYNNEAGKDALKLYIDLLYKYCVDSHTIKHDAEAFALGKTAMFEREGWVVGYMKEHAPKVQYDTALLPRYRRAGTVGGWENLFVSKSCKNPEVAWDFIQFMEKEKYMKYLLLEIGWQPCRIDVDYENIYKIVPQYRALMEVPEEYLVLAYPPIKPVDEIYTKLAERLIAAYLRKDLLDNPEGITKVIEKAAKETDEILKEAGLYGVK